jgi:hypothetical protein
VAEDKGPDAVNMITKPTVLVLGAGASCPYHFPSAFEIVEQLCREAHNPEAVVMTLEMCGFARPQVLDFLRQVKHSGQYSIDAFLQRQPKDAALRMMGKIAVVARLIEDENHLLNVSADDDWYRHFFARLLPKDSEGVRSHRLHVVTFNFDRSFERRLFLMIRNTYTLDDGRAALLAASIPVTHVHGQLGSADWLGAGGRAYGAPLTVENINACAGQIRLVDDEIALAMLRDVHTVLEAAHTICFIGFSFHPDNLDRLNAGPSLGNKTLCGTRQGMSSVDVDRVYRRFNSPRRNYLSDCSARQLFDVVDLFV